MKKLLSLWSLLMLFVMSGSAVSLTTDMYTIPANCSLNLGSAQAAGGTIYGNGNNITSDQYVDLSSYSTLTMTMGTTGSWRMVFNQGTGGDSDRFELVRTESQEVNQATDYYSWIFDGTNVVLTIDLQKILQDKGEVKLNAIKNNWGADALTVYSLELEPLATVIFAYTGASNPAPTSDNSTWTATENNAIIISKGNSESWTEAPITLTINAASASNKDVQTKVTNSEPFVRFWPQHEFTIEAPSDANYDYVITKVEMYGRRKNGSFSNFTLSGNIYTWTGSASSVTTTYSGEFEDIKYISVTYEATPKQVGPVVGDVECKFTEINSTTLINKYEVYLDDPQFTNYFRLRLMDNTGINFDPSRPCTVTTVDDMGDPIDSKIITLGTPTYSQTNGRWDRVNIPITPNTLGTVTVKLDYPGDATYAPATYYFDVKVKQHMVRLSWVDPNTNQETDEWKTNYGNQYNGIPKLKMYIDNVEVDPLADPYKSMVQYTSSAPAIASINSNAGVNFTNYVDFHAGGITVIEARFLNSYKTVDGLNYYYYNDDADSYTMILEYDPTAEQPHIIWITAARSWGSIYANQARGSYLGQMYTGETDAAVRAQYPFPKNYTHYGNDVFFSAIALKSSVTDAQLADLHIIKIPGYTNHYYVLDDPNEQWWNKGAWRANQPQFIPNDYFFVPAGQTLDRGQNYIKYMVDKPAMVRSTKEIPGDANSYNASGESKWPTKGYKIVPSTPSQDSLKVYAYIEGYNVFSTTKLLVNPGELQLRFVPDYGTVNAGNSISPYVNCPDLRMEDVKKIWLTYDCPNTLLVNNDGVVYEAGVTSNADIAKYLFTVSSNDTIYVNPDRPELGIQEIRPTTWLRGINPEIFGLSTGIGSECTVTLHLTSEMYAEATADYTLEVVGNDGDKPMFHWVVNHKKQGDGCVDDGDMKEISVAEGDFIYMPGICGNSNGNNDYSKAYSYKYLYGIKNGVITMNRAKYFPGEGVPNYFLTNTLGGEAVIPQSGNTLSECPPAIITWSSGLGDYWRYDSLMIYGNKEGVMYLYAQDPQTRKTCTPIKVTVVPKAPLNQAKQSELAGMTFPFTWDFENMDMTKYVADVENNSGTYWQKKFVEYSEEADKKQPKGYNRNYPVEKPFYQYNGGMNADWDDKDNNGTTRQRWFKDIYTGDGETVEYAPEFKGIMLNLSGLDKWEQKYQRFNIDRQGHFIYFEGGPIFLQLPGFGLTQNKNGKLKTELQGTEENPGTRSYDNYIGGEHNHINTAKYNVNEGYTQMLSVDNTKNKAVEYPVQEKYQNNKVRFVIKARGGRSVKSDNDTPNDNQSSQFHIGGASMIIENLTINDINWTQGVHNGYSYYNLDNDEPKVYIVELDPYDPELQDHIYLMFNNDVYVYWMAITNEPRNILSDFDGVTYSYPKDIDMSKTNLTLGMQTTEGIYTKADASGNYKLASVGEYTKKNVYQVGNATPGEGTKVQLKAYRVDQFYPIADGTHPAQSVTLTEVEGNLPKNEGVMLYTEPRMSALASNPVGLEPAWYDRGNTAWSEWVTKTKTVWDEKIGDYKDVEYQEEVFHIAYAADSTSNGNIYNNSHNYYYLPLYFIAMAENMSSANYNLKKPGSTGGGVWGDDEPAVENGSVNREGANLLRPVTYGKTLDMDYGGQQMINFGYNNEFICRHLVYQNGTQTKEMDPNDLYVSGSGSNAHEDMYYYRIGPAEAKFYRINTEALNHHNRSAYMTLTWNEYKVNTVGKPINIENSDPTSQGSNDPGMRSPIRFSPTSNPVEILFRVSGTNDQVVSEDGGFVDGINEVERTSTESNAVYNLNGVRVNNVSKGIYVIDGKKVVVK
ncbi:MAG: hypothetical protein IJK87_11520 [Prevotella sp.]|nr:hypothetical protein [Prevotella sp.]